MEFRLSNHAKKRLLKRGVREEWIQMTISQPDKIESDFDDPTLIHALKELPEKAFKRLRVIYNETTEPVTIVTAYFD